MAILQLILENIEGIVIALAVIIVLFLQYKKTGTITLGDVSAAVKSAEKTYIDSGGKIDRKKTMYAVLVLLFGEKRVERYSPIIESLAKAAILDLPPTTPRLKAKKKVVE